MVRTNRELLGRGQRAVHQVLAGVGGDSFDVVDPAPNGYQTTARRVLIDEAL